MGNLIGGVPKNLKIKCSCGNIISQQWSLKGIFELRIHKHEYYLSISEECERCGTTVCIYRNKQIDIQDHFFPVRLYLNSLYYNRIYDFDNVDMVTIWQGIFEKAVSKNINRMEKLFPQDITKFGKLLENLEKNNKK